MGCTRLTGNTKIELHTSASLQSARILNVKALDLVQSIACGAKPISKGHHSSKNAFIVTNPSLLLPCFMWLADRKHDESVLTVPLKVLQTH